MKTITSLWCGQLAHSSLESQSRKESKELIFLLSSLLVSNSPQSLSGTPCLSVWARNYTDLKMNTGKELWLHREVLGILLDAMGKDQKQKNLWFWSCLLQDSVYFPFLLCSNPKINNVCKTLDKNRQIIFWWKENFHCSTCVSMLVNLNLLSNWIIMQFGAAGQC